jgi:N-acetylglucosaminyldiphosphoundecaprenol N-acetyl-beta-D-mannosaminyltransferase
MFAALEWGRGGWVITANLEILRQIKTNPEMRAFAKAADLVVADGMPLVWASKLAGDRQLHRVAGSSLIYPLAEMSTRAERSVFFLGGEPGAADRTAEVLSERYPGFRVAGTLCPPFGFEEDPRELEAIRQALHGAKPDIVLVCLGAPKQEQLISLLKDEFPATWFLGLGISLGFVSGQVRRAPEGMQKLGLEWVHRMAQEPRRLGRRYLVDGLPFAARLGAAALSRRLVEPSPRRRREEEPRFTRDAEAKQVPAAPRLPSSGQMPDEGTPIAL